MLRYLKLGIISSLCTASLPFIPYPFAFAERALTFDWDAIGADVSAGMNQLDHIREGEKTSATL